MNAKVDNCATKRKKVEVVEGQDVYIDNCRPRLFRQSWHGDGLGVKCQSWGDRMVTGQGALKPRAV